MTDKVADNDNNDDNDDYYKLIPWIASSKLSNQKLKFTFGVIILRI
jgi:hypothetical protein